MIFEKDIHNGKPCLRLTSQATADVKMIEEFILNASSLEFVVTEKAERTVAELRIAETKQDTVLKSLDRAELETLCAENGIRYTKKTADAELLERLKAAGVV